MIRWESDDGQSVVRYDGFMTLVSVHRFQKANGLTIDELDDLIATLVDARQERRRAEGR